MPTDCTLPENCDNESCQRQLASDHEITTTVFDQYCVAFFGDEVPAALSVSRDTINSLLYEVDCSVNSVWISANYTNKASNSDISIQVARIAPNSSFTTRYSIAALRGVLLVADPISFGFSKATDAYGNTVIFKAFRNGNIVYCGDVTNTYP